MQLYFLEAKVPLTKSFARNADGSIDKSSYPLVGKFTSHEENVATTAEFFAALNKHAAANHCLLKGRLAKALADETRAGATNALDSTEFLVLDLDGVTGYDNAEAFIRDVLPESFQKTSYIVQHSASAGITGTGTRAHIFFLLAGPILPEHLKLWLTDVNLTHPRLSPQLQLSANATTLKFPLDRTVNQNDKLIYIAPPILGEGIEDPYPDNRIQLIVKEEDRVNFTETVPAPPALQQRIDAIVNEKREQAGLRKKQARYKIIDGEQVLANPDTAVVTGEKVARGWVYLNVNGGDSWGYYYDPKRPRFLYNFKGEPTVVLRDFLPAYWQELQRRAAAGQADTMNGLPERPFAFRDPKSDQYWNGLYDPINDRITMLARTGGGKKITDFFAQYGLDAPDPVEDWKFEFIPQIDKPIDFEKKFCNMWQPTEIIRTAKPQTEIPPITRRVIDSVVGNDPVCFDHFINWLACIYQFRTKTMTAWVFHGVEGTGKGVLFSKILTPIFGDKHCATKQIEHMEDQFNADLEHCLLLNINESEISTAKNVSRVVAKLKAMITDEYTNIRGMRENARKTRDYCNLIFTSNKIDAMEISPMDRRFNVAPRQETKLVLTPDEIEALSLEVGQFAGFLKAYPADQKLAATALDNDAKLHMQAASQDSLEQMCQALLDGNLEYFAQFLEPQGAHLHDVPAYMNFANTVLNWVKHANKTYIVHRSEIMAVYIYLHAPNQVPGPQKFKRLLEHKNIKTDKPHHDPTTGKTKRGLKVTWHATEEQRASWTTVAEQSKTAQPVLRHAA